MSVTLIRAAWSSAVPTALTFQLCGDWSSPPFPQGVFSLIDISQDLQEVLVMGEKNSPHKQNHREKSDKGDQQIKALITIS